MFTRIAAALGFCLLLAAPAAAQQFERNEHFFLPAGGTFAVRAVCPPDGRIFLRAYQAALPDGFTTPLANSDSFCVNGRTGLSFTVPPGEATQDITVWTGWDLPAQFNFKLRLDPDCAEGPTTTCVLTGNGDPHTPATAIGRFTWGGDADWYRLDGDLGKVALITPKSACVAVGKVVYLEGVPYLVVNGGPAGCAYTVIARANPTV